MMRKWISAALLTAREESWRNSAYKGNGSIFPDKTVEITTNEVSDYDADVEDQDREPVVCEERNWYAKVVEGIGNTVRETAHDE